MKISALSSGNSPEGRLELHSHTETCVLGAVWNVMEYTGVVSDVYPYSDSYKALKQVPVVEAVVASINQMFNIMLVLKQALYLGDHQEPSLLQPNQLRSYVIVVNDIKN